MQHAYNPDPKPVSQTTPEQMAEKLAKRCREVEEKRRVQPESQSPRGVEPLVGADPPPRLLTWCKPERGASGVRTSCGRYSCAKVTAKGITTYELWVLAPGGSWFRQLAHGLDSYAKAQDLAEQHARKP